jgi:putative membrane protein
MLYALINIASSIFYIALLSVLIIVVLSVGKLVLQFDFLGTWGQYYLYALLISVGAMLLFSLISLVGSLVHSFVGYHKFTVTKQGNNIQISYGLLEKHTNTFSLDRIKAVKIKQDFVARLLGFATIDLEVIGYTEDMGDNNGEIGVLVPFCKYTEVGEILAKILPDYVPDEKQTNAVSYFPFVSWFLLFFAIVMGVILAAAYTVLILVNVSVVIFNAVILGLSGLGFIVLVVQLVNAFLAFKTNGIAVKDGKITAYSGGFNKNVAVFSAKNLIAAENVTTPLRKKAGITSLVMHIRTNALSNVICVDIQSQELSKELEDLLVM